MKDKLGDLTEQYWADAMAIVGSAASGCEVMLLIGQLLVEASVLRGRAGAIVATFNPNGLAAVLSIASEAMVDAAEATCADASASLSDIMNQFNKPN